MLTRWSTDCTLILQVMLQLLILLFMEEMLTPRSRCTQAPASPYRLHFRLMFFLLYLFPYFVSAPPFPSSPLEHKLLETPDFLYAKVWRRAGAQ